MRALAFLVGALALLALARAPARRVSRRYAHAGALEPIVSPPVSVPAVAAGAFALEAIAVGRFPSVRSPSAGSRSAKPDSRRLRSGISP
jgi:hypothetical protein